jgi:hypothetical protein
MAFLSLTEVPSWRHTQEQFLVFELPGDIITAILSTWIDLEAFVKLDTVMCGYKARQQFLLSIRNPSFVANTSALRMCPSMDLERYVQQLARWITQRQVKVQTWIVDGDVASSRSPDLLPYTAGPHARFLQLRKLSSPIAAGVFSTFAAGCSNLQVLILETCQDWGSVDTHITPAEESQRVSSQALIDDGGCVQFPNVRSLYIRNVRGANVIQSVNGLLKAAPGVSDLRLKSSNQVCPINDESLHILSNHAVKLQVLELDIQRQEFSSAALVALAERCSDLETLALLCGDMVDHTVVEAFAVNCSRLEGLQLWGLFTTAALSAVATHCGLRLRYLTLDMKHRDGDGLVAIAEHCRQLEELQLRYCKLVPNAALVQLVSSLPHLRELLLQSLRVVTDEVLIAVAAHLPKLTTLGMSGIKSGYTEGGAQAVVASLTQLRRFCIRTLDPSVFTPTLVKRWQETSPGLEVSDDYLVSTQYFERMRW